MDRVGLCNAGSKFVYVDEIRVRLIEANIYCIILSHIIRLIEPILKS